MTAPVDDAYLSPSSMIPVGTPRVLASGRSEGQSVDAVEYADGRLALLIDGSRIRHFTWDAGKVESCIDVYLRLVRD